MFPEVVHDTIYICCDHVLFAQQEGLTVKHQKPGLCSGINKVYILKQGPGPRDLSKKIFAFCWPSSLPPCG